MYGHVLWRNGLSTAEASSGLMRPPSTGSEIMLRRKDESGREGESHNPRIFSNSISPL